MNMKINNINTTKTNKTNLFLKDKPTNNSPQVSNTVAIQSELNANAILNKAAIAFKGYYGDHQPSKKLFWLLTGRNHIYEDNLTNERLFNGGNTGWKQWVSMRPNEALNRSAEQAIQSICTLQRTYRLPDYVTTPNYGDKWGRHANYIEINPRVIAKHDGGKVSEGLLNMIKLLPIIPPSPNSFANCIILSQLYPCAHRNGEGYTGYGSLYTADLHSGISKNLTSDWLSRGQERMGDDEMVKAFNDLAHIRGLKTGFRIPLSSGQLTVQGRPFNWATDKKAFVDACVWAIELGFDAIYFDSAKHVGFYDMGNYYGNGNLPTYQEMQEILYYIRCQTGRTDIAFIGEKCTPDGRFKDMGFTAGTDWGKSDSKESVKYESACACGNRDYASGPEVSNDNDCGGMSFEQRLSRIENSIFGYYNIHDKLPTYMQMTDIFPLCPYTNTHDAMLNSKSHSAYGDTSSHYNNVFNTSDAAFNHQNNVYKIFAQAMYL